MYNLEINVILVETGHDTLSQVELLRIQHGLWAQRNMTTERPLSRQERSREGINSWALFCHLYSMPSNFLLLQSASSSTKMLMICLITCVIWWSLFLDLHIRFQWDATYQGCILCVVILLCVKLLHFRYLLVCLPLGHETEWLVHFF